jgi:hypothetical protein
MLMMSREQRRHVIEQVRMRIWDAWEQGLSIGEIARILPTRRIGGSA